MGLLSSYELVWINVDDLFNIVVPKTVLVVALVDVNTEGAMPLAKCAGAVLVPDTMETKKNWKKKKH